MEGQGAVDVIFGDLDPTDPTYSPFFHNGRDVIIKIPPGTLITDAVSGKIIKDFLDPGEVFIVIQGGRGGRGNTHFKSSTHRSPRLAQPGEQGATRSLKLELKLLADVGLIGLPNAGKSTLISAISSASPKIGNYPFTTLTPNLGVVQIAWGEPFVVADIPGLIEGAHQGAGLGIQFLRHIERTRLLVHMIDAQTIDPQAPLKMYQTINNELHRYGHNLAAKPQILVLNKMDLPGTDTLAEVLQTEMVRRNEPTALQISAATRQGIDVLLSKIVERLDHVEDAQHPRP